MARTLYQKFRNIWKNKPNKTTPVTAEALMHIEQGIYDNSANMALKEIYSDDSINLGVFTVDSDGNAEFDGNVTNGDGVSLSGLASEVDEVRNIASGASIAKVFNTKEELDEWLTNPENSKTLTIGQNIYIIATGTPDYWWDGNGLQELETGKVIIEELSYDKTMSILNESGVA